MLLTAVRTFSATDSVSSMALPGGSSKLIVVKLLSEAGTKPDGNRGTNAIEPIKNAVAPATVVRRWVKHQLAIVKYKRIKLPSGRGGVGSLFNTCTAIIGVNSLATNNDAKTAITAVQPNWRNIIPGMPDIIAVGINTATKHNVVAITASAISLTASSAERRMDLPICL